MSLTTSPPSPVKSSQQLVHNIPIEEELLPDYQFQHFYPVKLGQVLDGAYEVVVKIGYGSSSTVWLAKDTRCQQPTRFVALKICTNDHADGDSASHELNISNHIASANPSHPGWGFVRTILDSFELKGPHGTHLCLVYEPLREPLWLLQTRYVGDRFSPDLLKLILRYILYGLDYLHSECHVIHTDLKPDNILVGLESLSVLEQVARDEVEEPSPHKDLEDRTIYLPRNDFGDPESGPGKPVLTDFDIAVSGDVSHPLLHLIQPDSYRAPEVVLGAPWSYSADIWNVGIMVNYGPSSAKNAFILTLRQMWDLLEGRSLCDQEDPEYGRHTDRTHLSQLIGLLGPPPKVLLDQGEYSPKWFNSEGTFKFSELIPTGISLADRVTVMDGNDKRLFLDFAGRMLQWLPENRGTAKELLADPWLHSFL
ncbi:kinase-like domain-containing protein [Gymnopilus junonius]|uniref:non-specific serine/threonine protein kinase n=1 Tax=Gymnopilus junonius TaxID=109634 RepID=A0A9P5TNT4_GYMJU|nr:kinase-like domain-containing protein [Gymnopilus junonius]